MTTALVASSHGPNAPALADDLQAVGIDVIDAAQRPNLLQAVLDFAADLVICFEQSPDKAFFEQIAGIQKLSPRPVAVFTSDPTAEKIGLAVQSGVHAYVIAGYGRTRLRAVVHLAQARFLEDHLVRKQLADVRQRFEERKLVDRAKGILMGARSLREEEAYRVLRSAAMGTKQRIGQTAQMVIDSAHYAEAVNRAGQLRMLSQRLAKLYALRCAEVSPQVTAGLLSESRTQIQATLATLQRSLSQPTFGDLLQTVSDPWARLEPVLDAECRLDRLREVDALAEEMLGHSERLTVNLEVAAFANSLHAINVAGRQRMLSQRLAKQAVMRALLPDPASAIAASQQRTATELADGLVFLRTLPLSSPEIARELAQTDETWAVFQQALAEARTRPGRERIAAVSETLLGHFERLTDMLERAIQVFISPNANGLER